MANIPQISDNDRIGNWTLNLLIPGKRYLGKLVVARQGILFQVQEDIGAVVDSLVRTVASRAMGGGERWVSYADGTMFIPADKIASVKAVKKFFVINRVEVGLEGGSSIELDYGILGVGKLVEAIRQISQK